MASKEFVMGARVKLTDNFSSPVSAMTTATREFKSTVSAGNMAVSQLGGQIHSTTGSVTAFAMGSRAAAMSSHAAAGGVAAFTASILGLGSVMGLITGLLTFKLAYDWLVKSNAEMETYLNTLTVVLRSSEAAKDTLNWATKFAADTPFEIPQVVEATARLETYGITARKTLGTIGDMASVMGKPLMQAVEAIADAQTGEIERLKEFGITKDMLVKRSQQLGVTAVDSKGSITDLTAFNAALFSIMEERYAGGMAMQSRTFKGMLSNLADFIGTVGREFGAPIFESFKSGLGEVLAFTDQLKANGTFDTMKTGAKQFSEALVASFTWLWQVGQRLVTIVGLLWPAVAPVFSFLANSALPLTIAGISLLADGVLKVSDLFIQNWGWIEPMLQGLGIAIGVYLVQQLDFAAMRLYSIATATRTWAMAQAALNVVMAVNPVYLMVAGIGLLIGAAIWVVRNWTTVKTFFADLWQGILSGTVTALTWIAQGCRDIFTGVAEFFANMIPQALDWGANIIRTLVDGILGTKNYLVDSVKSVFSSVRELMPFSDAKVGPFSQLTYSGGAIMSTMAEGVVGNTGLFRSTVNDAFKDVIPGSLRVISELHNPYGGVVINPAGNGSGSGDQGGRTVQITLGDINIHETKGSNAREIADEVISQLYERLAEAADIASTGNMAELL